ncbi:MAG: TonB-dependent receptor [Acidobacteriota bacterium]
MMKRSILSGSVFVGATLLLSAPLFSQETRGSIEGIVTDQQGGAVPGAAITVTNQATGVVHTTKTGSTGNYTIPYLPPGTYRVSAEAPGFSTSVNPSLVLLHQQTKRADFRLEVGATEQEVTVTSEALLLQTGDATMQGSISSQVLRELPLSRNVMQAATLMPGVTYSNSNFGNVVGSSQGGGVSMATNGLRDTMAGYSVDGVNMTNGLYSYPSFIPIVEGLEEVTVQTSNYSAEYGQTGGGRISYALKSGTNSFHGAAWEFHDNSELNARNFFSPVVPPGRTNTFGGVFGGPIRKNKLFFFGAYQGLRSKSYSYVQQTIPNEAQRNGDLSLDVLGKPVPIFKDPTSGQPFPLVNGKPNQIPASRISPTAVAAWNLLVPPTNAPGPFNWQGNVAIPRTNNQYNLKIDNVISDKDTLSGHFYISRILRHGIQRDCCPFITKNPTRAYNVALIETHTLSPAAVLVTRASYNRMASSSLYPPELQDADSRKLFSMNIPNNIGPGDVMNTHPEFLISGFTPIGTIGNSPNYQWDENYEIASNLSLVKGKHSWKMGFDLIRYRVGRFVNERTNGELNYSNSNPNGSGYALADFLLGLPSSSVLADKPITVDLRHTNLSFFITDKWRVAPRLILDMGLRYEFIPPANEHYGRMSTFSLTAPGQFNVLSPAQALWSTNYGNWAPRIGLTYQITNQDLIRTSFGTFYSYPAMLFMVLKGNNPPFVSTYRFSSAPNAPLTSRDAFPIGQALAGGVVAPSPWSSYMKMPRIYSWNFDLQHSFGTNMLLDIGYVGNRGVHLANTRTLNIPSDPGILCPISGRIPGCVPLGVIQPRRPLPNWGTITYWDDFGFSTYHGLQVRFEKRFSHGFSTLTTYAWSKSMDIASVENLSNTIDPKDHNAWYGPSDMDQRQRLNLTYLWELPVGRGRHWVPSNRVADAIVGGWSLSGTSTYHSGFRFSPNYSINLNNVGVRQLPARFCDGNRSNPTIEEWFDTACFGSPIPPELRSTYSYGFQGDAGRGILFGPHFGQWNIGLIKNFTTFENQYLQVRAEFYNAFNNVNFDLPAFSFTVGPGITDAARISSAKPARTITLAVRYHF